MKFVAVVAIVLCLVVFLAPLVATASRHVAASLKKAWKEGELDHSDLPVDLDDDVDSK